MEDRTGPYYLTSRSTEEPEVAAHFGHRSDWTGTDSPASPAALPSVSLIPADDRLKVVGEFIEAHVEGMDSLGSERISVDSISPASERPPLEVDDSAGFEEPEDLSQMPTVNDLGLHRRAQQQRADAPRAEMSDTLADEAVSCFANLRDLTSARSKLLATMQALREVRLTRGLVGTSILGLVAAATLLGGAEVPLIQLSSAGAVLLVALPTLAEAYRADRVLRRGAEVLTALERAQHELHSGGVA